MTGSNKLVYLYDDTGSPYGYVYNNATYYYERNAQGDVVSLFNSSGVRIANYTYDAWGNVRSITDQNGNDISNDATHQGNINPIRYRGYYYDAELNMYWLTTRFYDPEIGRFINADTQLNEGLLGNNLYAYCCNDPVNGHDPLGTCTCNTMGFDCSNCRFAKGTVPKTALVCPRIAVIYDARSSGFLKLDGKGFEVQGQSLIEKLELDRSDAVVVAYPYTTREEFFKAWNQMASDYPGEYEIIYILGHGYAGGLSCDGNMSVREDAEYTLWNLQPVTAKNVLLLSCNGATNNSEGVSVASVLAQKTGATVYAVREGKINYNYWSNMPYAAEGGYWVKAYPKKW